eukprot:gene9505-12805_t
MKYSIIEINGKGRGMVASEFIAAGEIISVEPPVSFVIIEPYSEVCCGFCAKLCIANTVYVINSNDTVKYCSEKCITDDYEVHKHEMNCLKLLKNITLQFVDLDAIRLVIRIAIVSSIHQSNPSNGTVSQTTKELVDILQLVTVNNNLEYTNEASLLADKVFKILKINKLSSYTVDELKHLLLIMRCNAHRIYDSNGRILALGLFPLTSMINHSCQPNCSHSFEFSKNITELKPKLIIRAMKDIIKGEEIVYSYVPMYQSTEKRQLQLFQLYCFRCDCTRCSYNTSDSQNNGKFSIQEVYFNNDDSIIDLNDNNKISLETNQIRSLEDILSNNNNERNFFLKSLIDYSIIKQQNHSNQLNNPCHQLILQFYVQFLTVAVDEENEDCDYNVLTFAISLGTLAMGCLTKYIHVMDAESLKIEFLLIKGLKKLKTNHFNTIHSNYNYEEKIDKINRYYIIELLIKNMKSFGFYLVYEYEIVLRDLISHYINDILPNDDDNSSDTTTQVQVLIIQDESNIDEEVLIYLLYFNTLSKLYENKKQFLN